MRRCAGLALLLWVGVAAAAPPPRYELSVKADVDQRRFTGRARIHFVHEGAAPLGEILLWRYGERFATRSPALNDYNFYWVYPRAFNPGGLRTGAVVVDGRPARVEVRDHPRAGPRTLLSVVPAAPISPGAEVTVEIDFELLAPSRYGAFGCFRQVCTFEGGFHPMLPALRDGAFVLDAPPARASYTLDLEVSRVSDVVVNGALHAVERGGRISVSLPPSRALALMVGRPSLRTFEREHRGVKLVLHGRMRAPVRSEPEQLLPYWPTPRADRVLDAVAAAVDLLAELGHPMPEGETIELVEGPLRMELARALPGFVLLSDQAFQIFPLKRFLKFHEFEIARAVFELYLARRVDPRERTDDVAWSPQVGASYLVDLYTLRWYRKEEYAFQILRSASFIPAIDRILYAPQVPFASAYFQTLEDPDPLRDSLTQFSTVRPRGKLIYAKLRDLVGDGVEQILRRQLGGEPLRQAAEAVHGRSLERFFATWLGPYPAVDYRFGDVRSERQRGGGFVHQVTLFKRGAPGQAPPVEPVELLLRDCAGGRHLVKWDGEGERHTFEIEARGAICSLEIDPRWRLLERLPASNDNLRFDNRRPVRWRFVYNNFGSLVRIFPTLGLDLSLDFSLSRLLDFKNAMRFTLYSSQATQVGVGFSYGRGFGRLITPAQLSSRVGVSFSAARIDPSFGQAAGAGAFPGTAIGVGASVGYSDQLYPWEPRRYLSGGLSGSSVVTVLDSGAVLAQGTLSIGGETLVPLADGQGLLFSLSGAITFGDLRIARQLLAAGGPGGLRGYALDALLGRMRVLSRVEYRHTFVRSLSWNLLSVLFIRGIGGGLFAEAGFVSACESYSVGEKDVGLDVGYTLRFFGEWFGVSQTTFNIDFAVPVLRNDRSCFGQEIRAADRTQFGFFFAFSPP
jgi:hypothetical protein